MYNLIEYSPNYSDGTERLWFFSKDEATNFNNDIANEDNFKSFKYKAKLFGNAKAANANRVLKNAAIAEPLKCLSNFWSLQKMPLINCKVELKLKWTKYCVLPAAGNESNINKDANANNIIFTIKDTKLYVLVVTLSARDNQNHQNLLAKDLKE